jgi:hypothetical protein
MEILKDLENMLETLADRYNELKKNEIPLSLNMMNYLMNTKSLITKKKS